MGHNSNDSASSLVDYDSSSEEESETVKNFSGEENYSLKQDLSPEKDSSDKYLDFFPIKQEAPLRESLPLSTQHEDLIPGEHAASVPLSQQATPPTCESLFLTTQTAEPIPAESSESLLLSNRAKSLPDKELLPSSYYAETISDHQEKHPSMHKISPYLDKIPFSFTNQTDPVFKKQAALPAASHQTESIPHKTLLPSSQDAELFSGDLIVNPLSSHRAANLGDQCQQLFLDDGSSSLDIFEGCTTEPDLMMFPGEENFEEWKKMAMENDQIKKSNKYIQGELCRLVKRFARSDVPYFTEDMEPDALMKALCYILEDCERKCLQCDLLFKTAEISKESSALSFEIDKSMQRVSKLVENLHQKVEEAERSMQIWQHLDGEKRNLMNFFENTIRYLSWKVKVLQGGEFVQLFLGEDAPFSELIVHLHNQTILNSILIEELEREKRVKLALIQDLFKLSWQRIFEEQTKMKENVTNTKPVDYKDSLRASLTDKTSTAEPEEISETVNDWTSFLEKKIKQKKDEIKRLKEKKLIAENEIEKLTLNYNETKQKYEKFQILAEIIQEEVNSCPGKVTGKKKFTEHEPENTNQTIRFSDFLSFYYAEPPSRLLREYFLFCTNHCDNETSSSRLEPEPEIFPEKSVCSSESLDTLPTTYECSSHLVRRSSDSFLVDNADDSIENFRIGSPQYLSPHWKSSPVSIDSSRSSGMSSHSSLTPPSPIPMDTSSLNRIYNTSLSPQLNRTFDGNPPSQLNRTFDRSPPYSPNMTFDRSDESVYDGTFDMSSPQLNRTFSRSQSPQLNTTYARSPSPQLNRTFAGSPSPQLNRTFARTQSPQLNTTFARSQSPQLNRTFPRSQSPQLNATYARSPSPQFNTTFGVNAPPQLNTTFGIDESPQLNRTFDTSRRGEMLTSTPQEVYTLPGTSSRLAPQAIPVTPRNQFVTPLISKASRFGYTDPGAKVLNLPPGDDLDIPTPFRKTVLLTSPQREEPLIVNIDVDPQPIVETESGEHIICDISVGVQPSGQPQDQISPVLTYGTPPAVTPTTARRHGMFTPKGIFRKKHFNVRRIYDPDVSDDYYDFDLPRSPQYVPRDARSPVGPLQPSPKLTDKSISWEKSFHHPHVSAMNRTFAASPAMNRTFAASPAMNRTFAASPAMNKTFAVSPAINRTFAASPAINRTFAAPPSMNRTFEVPPTLDRTYNARASQVMNRTFNASSPQAMDRTFVTASPHAAVNTTFTRSPSPINETSFYGLTSSPQLNRTFDESQSPALNQTFSRSVSPVLDETFERDQSPALNRTFNKSQSPVLNRTFDRRQSPQLNQTFNRSQSPQLNQTFNRSVSPALNRTFDPTYNEESTMPFTYASPGSSSYEGSDSYDRSGCYNSSSSYSRSMSPQANRTFDNSPEQNATFNVSIDEEEYDPDELVDLNKSFYV